MFMVWIIIIRFSRARKSEPFPPFYDVGHLDLGARLVQIFLVCLLKIEIAGKSLEGPTLNDIQEILHFYSFT